MQNAKKSKKRFVTQTHPMNFFFESRIQPIIWILILTSNTWGVLIAPEKNPQSLLLFVECSSMYLQHVFYSLWVFSGNLVRWLKWTNESTAFLPPDLQLYKPTSPHPASLHKIHCEANTVLFSEIHWKNSKVIPNNFLQVKCWIRAWLERPIG